MTALDATTHAASDQDDDPHAPKVAPDDPRLNLPRPRSRVLKMKPVIGVIAAILGLGTCTVLASVKGNSERVAVTREPPKVPDTPPVPAFIQKAPATPEPAAVPQTPTPLPPPAPLSFEPLPRPDPRAQQAIQQELARRAELERAEAEARDSDLFFQTSAPGTTGSPPPAVAQPQALLGVGLPGAVAPAAPTDVSADPNLQARKNTFLEDPRLRPDYLPTTLQRPVSPYEVKATTIIPATLVTGINSDLPGPIVAQVREQVYDTVTGQHLLIPQGARLLASYDSMVAWGQERVLLCWQRIIFPNGNSINLQCMPAADLKGHAGLADEVDHHWDRLLAAVGLSTVLSLGTQVAAGDTTGYQPTIAQSAARNAAGQINSAGQAIVQRQINIQPTITVRPGFGVNVIVTKDMVLEPYVD